MQGQEKIPSEFSVKYTSLQSDGVFLLESNQKQSFAKVVLEESREILSLSYRSLSDQILATAKGVCENSESFLEILDSNQKKIGKIIRKKKLLSPASYQIFNKDNRAIAEGTMNWLGTRMTLCDSKNLHREFVTFYRPYFRLPGDNWYILINNETALDPRLIVLAITLQTHIDWKNCEIKPPL